jgi:hypothetical protein
VAEEHRDRFHDQAGPATLAGIAADLLVEQAGDRRRRQVDVARLGDSVAGIRLR